MPCEEECLEACVDGGCVDGGDDREWMMRLCDLERGYRPPLLMCCMSSSPRVVPLSMVVASAFVWLNEGVRGHSQPFKLKNLLTRLFLPPFLSHPQQHTQQCRPPDPHKPSPYPTLPSFLPSHHTAPNAGPWTSWCSSSSRRRRCRASFAASCVCAQDHLCGRHIRWWHSRMGSPAWGKGRGGASKTCGAQDGT